MEKSCHNNLFCDTMNLLPEVLAAVSSESLLQFISAGGVNGHSNSNSGYHDNTVQAAHTGTSSEWQPGSVHDVESMPLCPHDECQQFETIFHDKLSDGDSGFYANSLVDNVYPPVFIRTKVWKIHTRIPSNFKLAESHVKDRVRKSSSLQLCMQLNDLSPNFGYEHVDSSKNDSGAFSYQPRKHTRGSIFIQNDSGPSGISSSRRPQVCNDGRSRKPSGPPNYPTLAATTSGTSSDTATIHVDSTYGFRSARPKYHHCCMAGGCPYDATQSFDNALDIKPQSFIVQLCELFTYAHTEMTSEGVKQGLDRPFSGFKHGGL
ncbi:hypothetical protein Tco_0357469, partial [Tanacetum coccineum]